MMVMVNQIRHKTLHGSPWRQSPVRRAVNPDVEVHQILSAGGASGGDAAASRRRPVVRYGQDVISPSKPCLFCIFIIIIIITRRVRPPNGGRNEANSW